MHSVRRRLTLVLAAGFGVLTGGSGLVLSGVVGDRAGEEFDASLLARARALVALTEQEGGRIELDYSPEHMPEFERAEHPEYFQFWLDDGTSLLRSRRLDRDLARTPGFATEAALRDGPLPDGRDGRFVQIAWVPKSPGEARDLGDAPDPPEALPAAPRRGVVLVVARGRERLDGLVGAIRGSIAGLTALGVLLGVLFAWRALAAGFRPIDSIAAQVERLDADRLGAKVVLDGAPSELARVVEQLNALLGRLGASLARERRFASNVAHELRTPLAELRALADVGAKWPGDEASVTRYFADVSAIAGRMGGLVSDLLLLARCQAGVEGVANARVRVADLVASSWSAHARAAATRRLGFRADVPEDLVVESDPGKLSIVLGNLLGNAAAYARPDTEVRCVATRRGGRLRLEIANAAERLAPDDLDRLEEPFWRADAARSSAEHAGLGLSLVSALVALLRLRVAYGQDPDGTFRVVLEGPAIEPDPTALRHAPAPGAVLSGSKDP